MPAALLVNLCEDQREHQPAAAVWLPPLAVQTCHAPGEGLHEPSALWPHLRGLHRLPEAAEAAEPLAVRVLLADRGLAGLPAAVEAWGKERVAVSALVRFPLPSAEEPDVLLIAPEQVGYERLCRLLSRQAEEPERLSAWMGFDLGQHDVRHEINLRGLIAAVRDIRLGLVLQDAGAEVVWRCQDGPDGAAARAQGWPVVWLPIISLLSVDERQGDPIRVGLANRSRSHAALNLQHSHGLSLDQLASVSERFADHLDLIWASHELIGRCSYVPGGTWHMPPSLHDDPDRVLQERAQAGALRRYGSPVPDAVVARLADELQIITVKGFAGYILTVADLAAGRRTCGRGSGASSLVVYCLGITNVDPIKWKLLFSRFLSPSRIDPPDLDVDFPWDERDVVFAHALAVYGPAHVAMVAVHTRLRRDGALRAVARAWGIPDRETSAIAKGLRGQRRYGLQSDLPEPWPAILADAAAVEGVHLHDGLHCGGLVITGPPIRDLTPVHPAAKLIDTATRRWEQPHWEPVPAIAWEKDGAEQMGLVKIDILGNRSLAVIRDTLADLAAVGHGIDEASWAPTEDAETRRIVAAGDTVGCFYIESPAMRALQAKAASGDFDRLVIHSSIIRPAANRWIQTYLERLHYVRRTGTHLPEWYPHPALRGLLSESFGVLSYQEDVMQSAQAIAGFDEAGANGLRKALGHWDTQQRLLKYESAFMAGAIARGTAAAVAHEIWSNISSFAGYSFAKAHSASYAAVSFQAAYLKAHAPAAFHARVIANEGGFYSPSAYVEEARRHGVGILRPSVVFSVWKTAPEGMTALRIGLHLVALISRERADLIVAERQRLPFSGVGDLARRCRLPGRVLLSLARVGALDDLRGDLHHLQLVWLAKAIGVAGVHRGHFRDDEKERERRDLRQREQWIFAPPTWTDPPPPDMSPLSQREEAWERFSALHICVDFHPTAFVDFRDVMRGSDVNAAEHGTWVTMIGVVTTSKRVSATTKTASGGSGRKPMCFATLEDASALVETVWFPDAYRRFGPALEAGQPVRIKGQVAIEFGQISVSVHEAHTVPFATPMA